MKNKVLCAMTVRLLLACIFATGIAFSDSLKSALQYGTELEKKQSSLVSIKEDTNSINDAFKNKVERAIKRFDSKTNGSYGKEFSTRELSAIIPASSQPGLNIRAIPNGTLSPQGSSGIVNRGMVTNNEDKKE